MTCSTAAYNGVDILVLVDTHIKVEEADCKRLCRGSGRTRTALCVRMDVQRNESVYRDALPLGSAING